MAKFDPKEDYVELNVCDEAEDDGWFCRKVAWVGRKDAPDRFFAKNGRQLWIEFKRPLTKRARESQEREHRRMRSAGVEVHVCNDISLGRKILGLPTPPGGPF